MKLSSISSSSFITVYAPPPHRKFPLTRPRISFSTQNRVKLAESLQSETLKILEWPAVCKQLAAFTSTSMGLTAAQSARIPVGRSSDESRKLLAQTSAAVAFPKPLDFSGIEDISPIVDAAVTGELLSIRELCAVKRTLRAARSLFQQLEAISSDNHLRERCSPLLEILQNCNFLMELEQKIDFCIDCNFFVVLDQASEELEIIRLERKTNMETLESLLKQVSSQIFQAGGIDRPVVTKRRSRMCVAIRASHRSLLPDGIILDSSSSGATYFMEPKEAVDLNNMEIVAFLQQNAHPRVAERIPSVPENVTDQIRLWESDLNRVEMTPAHLYDEFPSRDVFESACDFARENGGLLWEDSKKMRLVVKAETFTLMKEFLRRQKQ